MTDTTSAAPTYDQIVAVWNAQADDYNQWDELGEDEKIEWAVECVHAAVAQRDAENATYRERWDAELGRTAMKFVDRAGDVHPGVDDAEAVCAEFHAAMSAVIERMPHVQRMNAANEDARAAARAAKEGAQQSAPTTQAAPAAVAGPSDEALRLSVDHAHEILRRLMYHRDGDFFINVNRRGAEAIHVSTIATIVHAALVAAPTTRAAKASLNT